MLRERDTQCAALDRALGALVGGGSPFASITGEPGTGRSALLRRAAERAAARGVRVLTARAVPAESEYPLGVTHALAAGLDGAPPADAPTTTVGPDVLHRWCRTVSDAAASGPLLLVVDDVQWADEESQLWLEMLLRRRGPAPVGLLVAVNGTHERAGWATAPSGPDDVLVRTGPLSTAAVRAVVTTRFGRLPDREFAVLARRLTGGNPAVLHAALTQLDRTEAPSASAVGLLRHSAAVARRDQVAAVLAGLGPGLVDALRAAAVCGPELCAVGDRIGGPGPSACAGVRSRMAATGLVRGPGDLTPVDDTVADAVLAGLDPARRRVLFTTAVGLAVRAGLPEENIARALLAAPTLGQPWAGELLHRVAARHRAAHRHDEAAAVAARALAEPVEPGLRGPLLVDLALARSRSRPRTAHRVLSRVTLCTDLAGSPHGVQAADLLLADGDVAAARLALTTAMRRCPDARPPDELLALGRLADDLGFGPAGLPGLPPGRSCDAGAGPASSGASAWALTVRGRDRERAVGLARAALSAVDADRTVPAMPRVVAALTLEAAGHVPEAVRALRHLLLEITRDRWAPPAVLALSAMVGLRSGDLDAARSDLAGAAASRSAAASPLVAAVRTLLHVEQGDRDAAASAAFDDDVAAGGRPGTALLEYARGRVRLGEGRPREAGELFMRCGRMLLDRGRVNPALVPWRSACAAAFHAAADDVAARRMAADERRRAEQWGAPGPVAVADAALRALDGPPVREVARAARS